MTTPTGQSDSERAVAELSALLERLSGALPRGDTQPEPQAAAGAAAQPPQAVDEVPEPAFRNLDDFMRLYLAEVVERRVLSGPKSGIYWCDRWWAHPEAISRFYAMWREWEKARIDDTMSTWWLHHLDPHLMTMTTEYGPFAKCEPGRHTEPKTLPAVAAPRSVLDQLPEG
ncbi:DUF4913 domain-containing protein [Micromonospora sp. MH99]|uniref:DUF4913 domain-containing protein n=1 Tax=Micromonospora sp. MH99 TaxID=1945510 RepID=UPI001F3A0C0D|nr:DUF4913 domain-containing protein [Micromonospora sp. MH99]MCF0092700.1 hypothetical protein [Micromonospora sp. MH99]